jgi:Zn-dependent protease with chaperone function
MVGELTALAGTRMPEEIRIVAGVEASVAEPARLLGLLPGKRYLFLGLPLLLALPQQQIRAIVAHELGHYSRAHTRLAPVAYRGRLHHFVDTTRRAAHQL